MTPEQSTGLTLSAILMAFAVLISLGNIKRRKKKSKRFYEEKEYRSRLKNAIKSTQQRV